MKKKKKTLELLILQIFQAGEQYDFASVLYYKTSTSRRFRIQRMRDLIKKKKVYLKHNNDQHLFIARFCCTSSV